MSKEFIRIVCYILIGAAICYFFVPNELNKNYNFLSCQSSGKFPHPQGTGIDAAKCCFWLKQRPQKDIYDKNCNVPNATQAGGFGICLSCGNGRCDTKYESKCNCPEDCK